MIAELSPALLGVGIHTPIRLPPCSLSDSDEGYKKLWTAYLRRPHVSGNLRYLRTALAPSTAKLVDQLVIEGLLPRPLPDHTDPRQAALLDLRGIMPDSRFWTPPQNLLALPTLVDGSIGVQAAAPDKLDLKPSLYWLLDASEHWPVSRRLWLDQLIQDLKHEQASLKDSGRQLLIDESELDSQVP